MLRFAILPVILALTATSATARTSPFDVLIPYPAHVATYDGVCQDIQSEPDTTLDVSRADLGEEGYELTGDASGLYLVAKTEAGLHYGRQTIRQLRDIEGNIPCFQITDVPKMRMRAVMLDLARCKERNEYYFHMMDELAKWKINTVFMHFTDHEGCAMEIKKYPQLTSKNAFTQDEMRELVAYAEKRHIELIPEVESWGHTTYITKHQEFADLRESEEHPGTVNTFKEKTWEVLSDIYDEVVDVFPSKYFHAGCDESVYGESPEAKEYLKDHSKSELIGLHLSKVTELVKSKGKTPMIWSDILLHDTSSADYIPKDTVICYWRYNGNVDPRPAEILNEKGFTILGCPAISCCGRMVLPATEALDNCLTMTRIITDQQLLGMETTIWLPQRYITESIDFALAYSCELAWSGERRSREDFAKAFAENYFGIPASKSIANTIIRVHDLAARFHIIDNAMWKSRDHVLSLADPDVQKFEMKRKDLSRSMGAALRTHKKNLSRNQSAYDALILATDYISHVSERRYAAFRLVKNIQDAKKLAQIKDYETAAERITASIDKLKGLAEDEVALNKRLEEAWDKWRYASDCPCKASASTQNHLALVRGKDEYMNRLVEKLRDVRNKCYRHEAVDWDSVLDVADTK